MASKPQGLPANFYSTAETRSTSLLLTSMSEDATSSRTQIEEMKHEPDSDTNLVTESAILASQTAISVHERRKIQHKQRIQRTQRILLKLLAGVGPSRIAEEEHISRSTVWRYRWR